MNLLERSVAIIKENQSSHGSYVASPNFSQYSYSWFRDGAFIADAMNLVGERESAMSFLEWGIRTIAAQRTSIEKLLLMDLKDITHRDLLPTRYLLNGRLALDNWPNGQSDGYGTFLWALGNFPDIDFVRGQRSTIELITEYLEKIWQIRCFDVWEEYADGLHTSTLLSIAAGLKASESLLERTTLWREIIDFILRNLTINGRFIKSTLNRGVDGSLCWAFYPFNLFGKEEPLVINTLTEIERVLLFEGGSKRYELDTYFGGGSWILLSAYLGQCYLGMDQREKALSIKAWIERHAKPNGELPEQVPEHLLKDNMYRPWIDKWGEIACPLLWSHAAYVTLAVGLAGLE